MSNTPDYLVTARAVNALARSIDDPEPRIVRREPCAARDQLQRDPHARVLPSRVVRLRA